MKLYEFLLLLSAMLVAPKIERGYVAISIALTVLAMAVALIDRFK
jgi:hypothetical protein